MYTEVTGKDPYTLSRLQSPEFNATTDAQCFSMKYHMYGTHIGNLSVYVTVGNNDQIKWKLVGNQGNWWKETQFNVESTVPFRITIKSVSGISWKGDVAVDNLFLSYKSCGKLQYCFLFACGTCRLIIKMSIRFIRPSNTFTNW